MLSRKFIFLGVLILLVCFTGTVAYVYFFNSSSFNRSSSTSESAVTTTDLGLNTLDGIVSTIERKPSTGKNKFYTYPSGAPDVPEDRSTLDVAAYDVKNLDTKRPVYTGDLKYTTLDILTVKFGGDESLPENIGTNDVLGKDLVIAFKQKFSSKEYDLLSNEVSCLPPIYLVSPSGDSYRIEGLLTTFSSSVNCGVYGSLDNEVLPKLRKNVKYKVVAGTSSDSRITVNVPSDLVVSLDY